MHEINLLSILDEPDESNDGNATDGHGADEYKRSNQRNGPNESHESNGQDAGNGQWVSTKACFALSNRSDACRPEAWHVSDAGRRRRRCWRWRRRRRTRSSFTQCSWWGTSSISSTQFNKRYSSSYATGLRQAGPTNRLNEFLWPQS